MKIETASQKTIGASVMSSQTIIQGKAKEASMKFKKRVVLLMLFGFLSTAFIPTALAQTSGQAGSEDLKKNAPNVFLKSSLDPVYFQKEIAFVNYVQSEAEAQVLVEITSQKTERGEEFTASFSGQKEFIGVNDVLKYTADMSKKPEEAKQELARILKLGLMRYVSKTPIASRVNVAFMDQVKPTAVIDKWNFWVFSLSVNSYLSGQKSYKMDEIFGSFSASRVTEEWKIRLSLSGSYYKNTFSVEAYNYESSMDSRSFGGLVVRSISDHWSVGAYMGVSSSTYNNTKLSIIPAPAIEYDLFPYSQSTKKQLRFLYKLGFNTIRYHEETIYDKMKENLLSESLSATLELKQPWGTLSGSLQGSHYFHNIKYYRLTLYGELSLRIFKGLNFNFYGSGSRIHDQLALTKGEATLEEVLLQRRQLETTYNYYFSIGISYTFGSILSKVVNPRFGSGSGTSISISM
jgi:hypothetical protein